MLFNTLPVNLSGFVSVAVSDFSAGVSSSSSLRSLKLFYVRRCNGFLQLQHFKLLREGRFLES